MKAPPTQSTKTPTGPETHRSVRVNINPRAPRSPPSVHTYSGSVSGGGGAARRGAAARCGSASVCRISCSSPTRRHITHITSPPVSSAEGGGGGVSTHRRGQWGGASRVVWDAEEENSANTPPTIQGEARVDGCATARFGLEERGRRKVSSALPLRSTEAEGLRVGSAGGVAPGKVASATL